MVDLITRCLKHADSPGATVHAAVLAPRSVQSNKGQGTGHATGKPVLPSSPESACAPVPGLAKLVSWISSKFTPSKDYREVYLNGQLYKMPNVKPDATGAGPRRHGRAFPVHEPVFDTTDHDWMKRPMDLSPFSPTRAYKQEKLRNFLNEYLNLPTAKQTSDEAAINNDDSLPAEQARAIEYASYGFGKPRDNRPAKCVAESNFTLRDNKGGGDCLFHALEGNAGHSSLVLHDVIRHRAHVAQVRMHMPEDERMKNSNGHEVALALNQSAGDGYGDARRPVSNAMFAALQAIPGVFAGDTEIQQWLDVPGNPVKSVVVIDAQRGNEALVTMTRGVRSSTPIARLGDTEDAISAQIASALQNAIAAENNPEQTTDHIALYRTAIHWQRITGLAPAPARSTA
jgi:hypothetical protein